MDTLNHARTSDFMLQWLRLKRREQNNYVFDDKIILLVKILTAKYFSHTIAMYFFFIIKPIVFSTTIQTHNQNMIYHQLPPDCHANYGKSEINLEY